VTEALPIAVVGAGAVAVEHHLPALAASRRARVAAYGTGGPQRTRARVNLEGI